MILISHRGNINGRQIEKENHPDYINEAIYLGYDVEIDIRIIDKKLFLGHDNPVHKIELNWIKNRHDKLWIHCKNLDVLNFFNKLDYDINYFWHESDTVTLTSKKYIWAYPGKQPIQNSIAVMPEIFNENISFCIGVCSDYIKNFK